VPAYVSGHATFSGAADDVLAHLFPKDARFWRARAREAGISPVRRHHWRIDNTEGYEMGLKIGRLVVRRAKAYGAER
jgi:hypothetical protein